MRANLNALALLLLLVAGDSYAETFIWGNEICGGLSTSEWLTGQVFSGSSSPRPTVSTTTFGDDTNTCSIYYDVPTLSASRYLKRSDGISSESTICAYAKLNVATLPTSASQRRQVLRFDDGSGNPTAILVVERLTSSTYRVRAYYEDDGAECQTSTNDGTECSDAATDCDEENAGEASCVDGNSAYASFGPLNTNQWYAVGLEQDNTAGDAGDVSVSMYVGEPGTVYLRGQQTRPQGSCSGGTNAGYACGSDADCPSSTCNTTDVKTVNDVYIGTYSDGQTDAWQYYLDDIVITDSSCSVANANYRIASLVPDSDITVNWSNTTSCNATGHYDCVNDAASGALDDETSYIFTNTNNDDETLGFTNLSTTDTCTSGTCSLSNISCDTDSDCMSSTPAIPLVTHIGSWRDNTNASSGSVKDVTCQLKVGSDLSSGVTYAVDEHGDTEFQLGCFEAVATAPDATSWDFTDINALEWKGVHTRSGSVGQVRGTAVSAEALILLPEPLVPNVLPDRNGDGFKTVGFIGNSRLNNVMSGGFVDPLIEPEYLYDCAQGGRTIGDLEHNLTNIINGSASGHLSCSSRRGDLNKKLDVALVMMGINTIKPLIIASPVGGVVCSQNADCPPDSACNYEGPCSSGTCANASATLACTVNSDCGYCTSGNYSYCYDDGGSDEGNSCYCPKSSGWRHDPAVFEGYCINPGDFGTSCTSHFDCGCSTDADCFGGTTCSNGTCSFSFFAEGATCLAGHTLPTSQCFTGCLNAPGCSSGVCMAAASQATVEDAFAGIASSVDSSSVEIVLVATPPAHVRGDKLNSSSRAGCWTWHNHQLSQIRSYLKSLSSVDADYHWVDAWSHWKQCCPNGDTNNCLFDGIHPNDAGAECIAEIMLECLENKYGTANGVCTASVCSQGSIGDVCSTNSDCDTYRCAF